MTRLTLPRITSTLFCFIVFATTSALAQIYSIRQIAFQGTTPYSQANLIAASGLRAGQNVSQADIQDANTRLTNTGAFTSVTHSIAGSYNAAIINFAVTPVASSHLLPVGFENFVWFQYADLVSGLEQRVPLFNGTVPDSGNQQDAIATALKQMLAAKYITAVVVKRLIPPSLNQPSTVAEYFVSYPSVKVRSITLSGVTNPFTTPVNATIAALKGTNYNEGLSPLSMSNQILVPYLDAGYLGCAFDGITRKITVANATLVYIDVTASIQPGSLYYVSGINWPGSPVMSVAQFNAATKLHPGNVASRQALAATLGAIDTAYRNSGYLEASLAVVPAISPASHSVSFTITPTSGPQYTLESVTPVNLTASQLTAFKARWKLAPGSVYSESYVDSFVKSDPALPSYVVALKTNPGVHKVDLTDRKSTRLNSSHSS